MSNNLDQFNVLRKIKSNPNSSQRELASSWALAWEIKLLSKALSQKGLIKIKNFQKNPIKLVTHIF